jgi:hypothetical protein
MWNFARKRRAPQNGQPHSWYRLFPANFRHFHAISLWRMLLLVGCSATGVALGEDLGYGCVLAARGANLYDLPSSFP